MANTNPISIGQDGEFINFEIPQENLQDDINVSVTIELLDDGWTFDADHIISLQGQANDLFNSQNEPNKVNVGKASGLIHKKFRTISHIRRFRNGADTDVPSRVKYTMTFFAGDNQIAQFSQTSGRANPVDFITDLQYA